MTRTYIHQLTKPQRVFHEIITGQLEVDYADWTLNTLTGIDNYYTEVGNERANDFITEYFNQVYHPSGAVESGYPVRVEVDHGREGNTDRKIIFRTCYFEKAPEGSVACRSSIANNRIAMINTPFKINVEETLNNNFFNLMFESIYNDPPDFTASDDLIRYFSNKSKSFKLFTAQIMNSISGQANPRYFDIPGNYIVYTLD